MKHLLNKHVCCAVLLALVGNVTLPASATCNGMSLHAHRGAPSAPENSLSAAKQTWMGEWNGLEIDIQLLKDGAWVLHHDERLGRTTSLSTVRTTDIDSATWREVRLKERKEKNPRVTSEPAPFFADVLAELEPNANKVLNIEIKHVNAECRQVLNALGEISKARPDGRWFFTSFNQNTLKCIRRADPNVYLGNLFISPKAAALQQNSSIQSYASRFKLAEFNINRLQKFKSELREPVGIHIDIFTLQENPTLLADARSLDIPVFTYHPGSDREHALALKRYAHQSSLLPTGAIIDGLPEEFCQRLTGKK